MEIDRLMGTYCPEETGDAPPLTWEDYGGGIECLQAGLCAKPVAMVWRMAPGQWAAVVWESATLRLRPAQALASGAKELVELYLQNVRTAC